MKRNIVALFLVILLIISVLGGCSQESSPSTSSSNGTTNNSSTGTSSTSEPYKVHFWAWTNPDNVKPLIEQFNKDFAGKYELVYEKLADAETLTINTALASGEPIDVMTQSGAFDTRVRADSGQYLALNEFFDAWGKSYAELLGPAAEEVYNFDGKYYAVPYCRNIQVVYFNKKMFDAAGVPYPDPNWTWDDFRETAKKLTHGEGANKVYGVMADFANEYWREIAMQKLGNFWYYNEDFTATRFDDPAVKESLQFWYDMAMVDKTCVPLDEYKALKYDNDTTGMNGLYQGKYAMLLVPVYGSLYLNESYGKIPEGTDIGMTNMPLPAGSSKPITTFYTSTASIPANVKNKEAAWTLLKYICFDRADLFAGPKAMHPGYDFETAEERRAFEDIIFDHPGLDKDMAMQVMALPRDLVCEDNSVIQGQAVINELIKADISKVFNGEMSVDDCVKDLKSQGDAAIAKDLKK
ncbi:extracellular solute-binding protein [Mahella sp.]|uniref:ABC transporter substrate-binding protein n=1 Tax=Mahella sp. TaxID=2798721 RepID=UPI0025C1440A|nr:extracellular solute-binding protein [Mahella sp.]MBZ4665991.1 putative bacterial extracellular solute-binding protein [Mahella sp.]MDK2903797.1 multiple sugar transport system substrate-binding protein [Clostridiales bacterium]